MTLRSISRPTFSKPIISYSASYSGRRYGSTFCARSPGRKPSRSPASTAGRTSTMRWTRSVSSASTAQATARKVLPVPAGPTPKLTSSREMRSRYRRWLGPRARIRPLRVRMPTSAWSSSGSSRPEAWRLRLTSAEVSTSRSVWRKSFLMTRRAALVASGSPSMAKMLPRELMSTPRRFSISRRCSSNGPHRLASRWLSAGSSSMVTGEVVWLMKSGHLACGDPAAQRIGHGRGDLDIGEVSDQRFRSGEVDHPIVLSASGQFARVLAAGAFDQHTLGGPDHGLGDRSRLGVELGLKRLEPGLLLFLRHVIGQAGGRRAGARRVDEAEALVEIQVADQFHGLIEIGLGLAGKADDEIRGKRDVRSRLAQPADAVLVFQHRVPALHQCQHPVGAGLYRQVQIVGQLGRVGVGLDQPVGEFHWVRGREADALDAVERSHVADQHRQIRRAAVMHGSPVGVDVLAQQIDLAHALGLQPRNLGNDVVQRPAYFLAAGIRHDAKTAVFGTAFHDRHERARPVRPRRRQVIELLDFREACIDRRLAGISHIVEHLRQPVDSLRSEHHIDVWRTLQNAFALLAGHAAGHADDHVRARLLQRPPMT